VADYPEDLDRSLTRGELSLLGVGWREIGGPLWRTPYRDVHVWAGTDPAQSLQRALDASALLPPEGALGGWASATVAAAAHGATSDLDGGQEPALRPVMLCLPPRTRRRRGPGVRPLRSHLLATDVVELDHVRVTTAVRTAFDLARTATSLSVAVTALDVLARGRPDLLDMVRGYADDRRGWLGVPRVRQALRLASDRSRSPGESALRMLWQLDAGLPPPMVNPCVLTGEGDVVAMVDLLDEASGLVGEYDGAGHREARQHALDNSREESVEGLGLTVSRVTSLDLSTYRSRTVARLQDAHRRARRSARGPRTWWAVPGPLPPPHPFW